ncbi:hypothetical protein MAIT1_04200 [Magnetofaba australis IT-1]|uniref:TPR repeat-containing protein n=1 Tax=Magnetofaba australis IT-1 TaxID=1434232 RepID=A0A1Y2K5Q9_9PROT|nr:hypothetical protein MAIT1_04200 [Magnetofaba australis IT-1]
MIAYGLLLFSVLLYAKVTQFGLINYDDHHYITYNQSVQDGFTLKALWRALTSDMGLGHWMPALWISYMLDAEIYGEFLVQGAHLTNILLHAANVYLLYFWLQRATGRTGWAATAALIFAAHPQHVEAVVWVTERKEVLSALFGLGSLLAYWRAHQESGRSARRWRLFSLGLFAFSLMSQPKWITLPFLLVLVDLWPGGRPLSWALLRDKIPFFGVMILSAAVTLLVATETATGLASLEQIPLSMRLWHVTVSYKEYLLMAFYPADLAGFYSYPMAGHPFSERIASALLLLGVTGVALWRWRVNPWLLVGWLWFLGSLFPVSGIAQIGAQGMADRFTYLPHMGLFIAVVWQAGWWLSRWRVNLRAQAAIALAAALLYGANAFVYMGQWRDSITLWNSAIQARGEHYFVNGLLARAYWGEGDVVMAGKMFEKALAEQPNDLQYRLGAADMLLLQGRVLSALSYLYDAQRVFPDNARVLLRLGLTLMRNAQFAEAAPVLAQVREGKVEWDPTARLKQDGMIREAAFNQAVALVKLGRVDEAAEAFNIGFEEERESKQVSRCRFVDFLRQQPEGAAQSVQATWTRWCAGRDLSDPAAAE